MLQGKMQSAHELHVDLVRLLIAAERLVSAGHPSADGSWEHWPRLCQFITSLDSLQSQLQVRAVETHRSSRPQPPTAEDLSDYDRRLETLRRTRDDLSSAAAAAAAAEAAEATTSMPILSADAPASSSLNDDSENPTQQRKAPAAAAVVRGSHEAQNGGRRAASGGVFGGRHGGGGGGDGGQETDEAEADQMAQEISSMAGRLKESSMAINQTLRTQTQVLEDTGDAATQNVDRVTRENKRVAERLRKKRAAMFASWCMMFTVLVAFFATYALVIMPFEKRRGPFVRPRASAFAHASEQTQPPPQQQQQQPHGDVQEEFRQRSEQAYVDGTRRARENQESANAGLRLVAEERERARERQTDRMMQKARDRKMAAAAAKQKAKVDEDKLKARAVGGTQLQDKEASGNQENGGEQETGETVKIEDATAEQEEGGGVAGVGHAYDSAKAAEAAEEYRRKAQQAYEERSRLEAEIQASANAGLRLVAEEKERYRQRHTEKIIREARERRAALPADGKDERVGAELSARDVGGSAAQEATLNVLGHGGEDRVGVGGGSNGWRRGEKEEGRDEQGGVVAEGDGDSREAVSSDAGVLLPPADKETEQLAGQPTKGEASLAHEELSREKREERETESAGGRVIREGNGEDRRRYTDNNADQQTPDRLDQEAEVDSKGQATLPQTHAPQQRKGLDSGPAEQGGAESLDAVRERLRANLAKSGKGRKRDEL